jgi:hypothetical protein
MEMTMAVVCYMRIKKILRLREISEIMSLGGYPISRCRHTIMVLVALIIINIHAHTPEMSFNTPVTVGEPLLKF